MANKQIRYDEVMVGNLSARVGKNISDLQNLLAEGASTINSNGLTSKVNVDSFNSLSSSAGQSLQQGSGQDKENLNRLNQVNGTSDGKIDLNVQRIKSSPTGGDDRRHFNTKEQAVAYLKDNIKTELSDKSLNSAVDNMVKSGEIKIDPSLSREAKEAEWNAQHTGENAYNKAYAGLIDSGFVEEEEARMNNVVNRMSQEEYNRFVNNWKNPDYVKDYDWRGTAGMICKNHGKSSLEENVKHLARHGINKNIDIKKFVVEPQKALDEAHNVFGSNSTNSTGNITSSVNLNNTNPDISKTRFTFGAHNK